MKEETPASVRSNAARSQKATTRRSASSAPTSIDRSSSAMIGPLLDRVASQLSIVAENQPSNAGISPHSSAALQARRCGEVNPDSEAKDPLSSVAANRLSNRTRGQNSCQANGLLSSAALQARRCAEINPDSEAKGLLSIAAPSRLSGATTARHSSHAAMQARVSKAAHRGHLPEHSAADQRRSRRGELRERNSQADLRRGKSSALVRAANPDRAQAVRSNLAGIASADDRVRTGE